MFFKKIYDKLVQRIFKKIYKMAYQKGYKTGLQDARDVCYDVEACFAPIYDDANDPNTYRAQGAAECVDVVQGLINGNLNPKVTHEV